MTTTKPNRKAQYFLGVAIFLVFFLTGMLIKLAFCGLIIGLGAMLVDYGINDRSQDNDSIVLGSCIIVSGLGLSALTIKRHLFPAWNPGKNRRVLSQDEAPALFDHVAGLANKTGVRAPTRIIITKDVNAGLALSHRIIRLFGKGPSDLYLGLPLFTLLTESELRSVIAHELGHYMPQSMRSLTQTSAMVQALHGIYSPAKNRDAAILFCEGARLGIWGLKAWLFCSIPIDWLWSKGMNSLMILFLESSREAEFLSDKAAATLVHPQATIQMLQMLELGNEVWNLLLDFYRSHQDLPEIRPSNVFEEYRLLLGLLCKQVSIPIDTQRTGLAERLKEVIVEPWLMHDEQWRSHPLIGQRINRIQEANHTGQEAPMEGSPWNWFANPQKAQAHLTNWLFSDFKHSEFAGSHDPEWFLEKFRDAHLNCIGDPRFKGIYDFRPPLPISESLSEEEKAIEPFTSIDDAYSDLSYRTLRSLSVRARELHLLALWRDRGVRGLFFDFKGQRYTEKHLPMIIEEMTITVKDLESFNNNFDLRVFKCYLTISKGIPGGEQRFLTCHDRYRRIRKYNRLIHDSITTFAQFATTAEQEFRSLHVTDINLKIKEKESALKEHLTQMLDLDQGCPGLSEEAKDITEKFLHSDWTYIATGIDFNQAPLQRLKTIYETLLSETASLAKKEIANLLEVQLWIERSSFENNLPQP